MTHITAIAALSRNRVIGDGNRIPWHIPEDFKHFKRTTMGHPIIMGRKTFESLGAKPLPGRAHFIITRTPQNALENVTFVPSLEDAIKHASALDDEIFICGGAQIYAAAMPLCTRMILTHIEQDFPGDTFFPTFDQDKWDQTELARITDPIPYRIMQYDLKKT